jgi:hypothetical protein
MNETEAALEVAEKGRLGNFKTDQHPDRRIIDLENDIAIAAETSLDRINDHRYRSERPN